MLFFDLHGSHLISLDLPRSQASRIGLLLTVPVFMATGHSHARTDLHCEPIGNLVLQMGGRKVGRPLDCLDCLDCLDWESGAADGGGARWAALLIAKACMHVLSTAPSSPQVWTLVPPEESRYLRSACMCSERRPHPHRCGRSFRRRRAVTFGRPFPKMGVRTCSRSCRRSGQRKRSGTCAVGSSSRRHEIA